MAAEAIPEQLFGKYRLLGVMSAGGMAELYLALQAGPEGFSKVVALKRVLPHLADSHDFVQMFMDEARLAARLDHPNIVRIYDFGESNRQYFMAMEYLPGEDLSSIHWRARKAGQVMPHEIACAVVQAAAEGLHFAHELTDTNGQPLHLVHRDANPSNILVTYQGVVKVADFGIAKAMGNVNQTQFGQVKGKAAYLAPEQATGETLDRRADVFCLGIVLWESLTGQRLFSRETEVASAQASVTYTPPLPSKVRPGLPAELDLIILRALAKRPEQRYQTAQELADELEDFFRRKSMKPTAKEIAAWMEGLFGRERAEAKLAIAQGRNLQAMVSQVMRPIIPLSQSRPQAPASLASLDGQATVDLIPRGDRSNTLPLGTATQSATVPLPRTPARPPAALGKRLGLVAALVVVAGGLLWAGNRVVQSLDAPRGPRAAATVPTTLELDSSPPGAFIFVGGEPTGQFTPARLNQLTGGQVAVRLELAGYEPARETVPLEPGKVVQRKFVLTPQPAEVAVRGVPEGAQLLVDGKPTQPNRTLTLTPGPHVFVVKQEGKPDTSRLLDVKPGEQRTLELP
jgi:serine/threonine-protein kinase